MIKRILVPLDPSPYSKSAVHLACQIAKVYQAEITGLVILDIPGIEESIGPVPIGGIHLADKLEKQKTQEAKERIETLLDDFKKTCQANGIVSREAERQGSPSKKILEESNYYDLVFIGLKTYFNFETSEDSGRSLDVLLKESITPIYGVPATLPFLEKPERKIKILMAFDGSPLAARAMQRFAQLVIPELYEITLVNVSEEKEHGLSYLSKAEEYLGAHAIKNVNKQWHKGDVQDIISKNYYNAMDGFVIGAHSREGLFDFLVGSLTKYLVKQAEKPVFIGM